MAFVGGKSYTVTQSRSWPGQEKGFLKENLGKILKAKKKTPAEQSHGQSGQGGK